MLPPLPLEAIAIEPVSKRILVLPLLLEADPSPEAVLQYLQAGECYVATESGKIIGAYVLQRTRPFTAELMNVVVRQDFRKLGIGKLLVAHAIQKAKEMKVRKLEVGTGNSSISALAFYQKMGFRITGVEPDYFTHYYPQQIEENGICCRDQIRLSLDF